MLRVSVTNQAWDFIRPWGKRPPYSRRAVGTVLKGGRVLVTGELVANANYVELETPDGGGKMPATVEVVDYEANLALLKAEDPKFMEQFASMELASAVVGDSVSAWQLESTGTVLATPSSVTTVEVGRYPMDDSMLLVYRMTVPLQFRDGSFTLPVVRNGKLVGLVMRYDNNTKSAELVPTPVIEHFLKDAADGNYEGFPKPGISFANTRDPQFRRYAGLGERISGGVYVTGVTKGGPADKAGMEVGDVLLRIAGQDVDRDGNYLDPSYGKLLVSHLVTRFFLGETMPCTVLRKGQRVDLKLQMARRAPWEFVVDPYVIDRAPRFYLLGGLLLQELSRQHLKEWGAEWQKKAPEEFLYVDREQEKLFPGGGRKVVILSGVLPSAATIGYENLQHLVVRQVNGVPINRLSEVPEALTKAQDGMHKIEFDGEPGCIYLDAQAVSEGDRALQRNYRIPVLSRLE